MADNAAFEDLELDVHDMMSDPEAFTKRVYAMADELVAICKADHSVNGVLAELKKEALPLTTNTETLIEAIYKYADNGPLQEIPSIIARTEKLLSDLKTLLRDKAIYETGNRQDSMSNKRVAHAQYTALREKFNLYVKFMNNMMATDLDMLPSLPGNYNSQSNNTFKYYVFKHEVHGEFRNHRAVINKLIETEGLDIDRSQTLMDFIESEVYLPFGWEVKEFH